MGSVSFDQADEQIDEKLLLSGRQRCEHALIRSAGLWTQPAPQSPSLWRQIKLTSPPVVTVNATLDQSLQMETFYDETCVSWIDAHRLGQPALIESRLNLNTKKRPLFQLHQLFARQSFGDHRRADQMEAAGQRTCCPNQRRCAAL